MPKYPLDLTRYTYALTFRLVNGIIIFCPFKRIYLYMFKFTTSAPELTRKLFSSRRGISYLVRCFLSDAVSRFSETVAVLYGNSYAYR
jgi:hypothetical protein